MEAVLTMNTLLASITLATQDAQASRSEAQQGIH